MMTQIHFGLFSNSVFMTCSGIIELRLLIDLLISLVASLLVIISGVQFRMVASIGAFEDEVGEFILALFNADIQQGSEQKTQDNSSPTLKKDSDEQTSQDFAEARKILLQSIDPKTKAIKDFQGLAKAFDFGDEYVNKHWDLLPEKTRVELTKGSKAVLDVLPDFDGPLNLSKILPAIYMAFRRRPWHNLKRLFPVGKSMIKDKSPSLSLLRSIHGFANSVQRLNEEEKIRKIKPTAMIGQILDYLDNTTGWEGDDLEKCLEIVRNNRSQAEL